MNSIPPSKHRKICTIVQDQPAITLTHDIPYRRSNPKNLSRGFRLITVLQQPHPGGLQSFSKTNSLQIVTP
jgi:hypothetical protein